MSTERVSVSSVISKWPTFIREPLSALLAGMTALYGTHVVLIMLGEPISALVMSDFGLITAGPAALICLFGRSIKRIMVVCAVVGVILGGWMLYRMLFVSTGSLLTPFRHLLFHFCVPYFSGFFYVRYRVSFGLDRIT